MPAPKTFPRLPLLSGWMLLLLLALAACSRRQPAEPTPEPIRRVVDLSVGESAELILADSTRVTVALRGVTVQRDSVRRAVRRAEVAVEVNGQAVTLISGNYQLPLEVAGVRVDCPAVRALYEGSMQDSWALEQDARLRLWPGGGPLVDPAAFGYPLRQRWLGSHTQMANEPTYADGPGGPWSPQIYYHSGLDWGGVEGLTEVISACAGTVVQVGDSVLAGNDSLPLEPRYESVFVLGPYGWVFRYSHLHTIDPALRLGGTVEKGRPIGLLGKEGNSGGWAHLHFEVQSRQPNGEWGTEEAFAYAWESYVLRYAPPLMALARPHHEAWTGQAVTLDGSLSRGLAAPLERFEWSFEDGTTAEGPLAERTYDRPGQYCETLKVIDQSGNFDYDFVIVQVVDPARPEESTPALHAACHPTQGVLPGQELTFAARAFSLEGGEELWDFGDGSPTVVTGSKPVYSWNHPRYQQPGSDWTALALDPQGYARTTHAFAAPGDYLVTVRRTGVDGRSAAARLYVRVRN